MHQNKVVSFSGAMTPNTAPWLSGRSSKAFFGIFGPKPVAISRIIAFHLVHHRNGHHASTSTIAFLDLDGPIGKGDFVTHQSDIIHEHLMLWTMWGSSSLHSLVIRPVRPAGIWGDLGDIIPQLSRISPRHLSRKSRCTEKQ